MAWILTQQPTVSVNLYGNAGSATIVWSISGNCVIENTSNGAQYTYPFSGLSWSISGATGGGSGSGGSSGSSGAACGPGTAIGSVTAYFSPPGGIPAGAPGTQSFGNGASAYVSPTPPPPSPPPAPAGPTNATATDHSSYVVIAWTASTSEGGGGYSVEYVITRKNDNANIGSVYGPTETITDNSPIARPITYEIDAYAVGDGSSYSGTTGGTSSAYAVAGSPVSDSAGILIA